MREIAAMLRAGWLTALSYRMNLVFSILGLVLMLVPIYFVAGALQPVAANSIRSEGGQYLGFLIIGMALLGMLQTALLTLPNGISGGIGSGTLEAMLATPARLPALLVGMVSYDFAWSALRAMLMVGLGVAFGVPVRIGGILPALLAAALTVAAYFGISLGLAGMMLTIRTIGPFGSGLMAASALLGGAYYSVSVIPSWIRDLSALVPLTYGLRAVRQSLLAGATLPEVGRDLLAAALFAGLLLLAGGCVFLLALTRARREGSLGQY